MRPAAVIITFSRYFSTARAAFKGISIDWCHAEEQKIRSSILHSLLFMARRISLVFGRLNPPMIDWAGSKKLLKKKGNREKERIFPSLVRWAKWPICRWAGALPMHLIHMVSFVCGWPRKGDGEKGERNGGRGKRERKGEEGRGSGWLIKITTREWSWNCGRRLEEREATVVGHVYSNWREGRVMIIW